MNGSNFLLMVNTGTSETPTFEMVGYQRDASVDEASETIDVSSKEQREQRVLAGRYTSTLTLAALYVPNDDAYNALKEANRNGNLILVAREWEGQIYESAMAKVDSISETFPDQEAATISVSLTVDGAWTNEGS